MFLRSVGSRFSIQRGALLLRRVPVRAATGARPAVVEENGGDTSLVGDVYLCTSLRNSTKKNERHFTDEGLTRLIPLFLDKNASVKHLGQFENHGSWNKQKNKSNSEQRSAFRQVAIEGFTGPPGFQIRNLNFGNIPGFDSEILNRNKLLTARSSQLDIVSFELGWLNSSSDRAITVQQSWSVSLLSSCICSCRFNRKFKQLYDRNDFSRDVI